MENVLKWQVSLQKRVERNALAEYFQKDKTLKSGLKDGATQKSKHKWPVLRYLQPEIYAYSTLFHGIAKVAKIDAVNSAILFET